MAEFRLTTQTLAVLAAMLREPRVERYGLQLCEEAGLRPGTIYPILDRLLKAGWLSRRWEDIDPAQEGRPARRLYRLTAHGALAAQEAVDRQLALLRQTGRPAWKPAGDGII